MLKSIVLGNGNIFVGLNEKALVSDFYFPYVGLENQVQGDLHHRVGVYVDDQYSSLSDGSWSVDIDLVPGTLVSAVTYTHQNGLVIETNDAVYNEKNIFLKRFKVTNNKEYKREVKIFCSQVFGLYGSTFQDTAYYDPDSNVLIHYEGQRIFCIYAQASDIPFDDYSVGLYMTEGKEGTFRDAEDGVLGKNGIEHGQVDSTLGVTLNLYPGETKEIEYWITVGESKQEVYDLHSFVKYKSFAHLLQGTADFWSAWVQRNKPDFKNLSKRTVDLYNKSMFYVRAHIDNRGAIIASGDSGMLAHGRDTYSYMWPRDGALSVTALLMAGEMSVSKRFFKFCNDVQEEEGYMMHKYRADRSLGSSWHPFIKEGEKRLPIQEDETALVMVALYEYYKKTREIEFVEQHYADFIYLAGNFLATYIDKDTGLPEPSYDLWEEKYGISTYTASTVYAGLLAVADIAQILGKDIDANRFREVAQKMKNAIIEHLYLPDEKMFCKSLTINGLGFSYDKVIDISSIYGVFFYTVLPIDDAKVIESIKTIEEKLFVHNGIGGVPRYINDEYFMVEGGNPNPWYICTLWLAQYYIMSATKLSDLEKPYEFIEWVNTYTPKAGAMSEQLHVRTGEQLSATPLTWSHGEYIRTVHMYIDMYNKLA
jgi:GH15 family glucan-1,4-alpha-glucosidase